MFSFDIFEIVSLIKFFISPMNELSFSVVDEIKEKVLAVIFLITVKVFEAICDIVEKVFAVMFDIRFRGVFIIFGELLITLFKKIPVLFISEFIFSFIGF